MLSLGAPSKYSWNLTASIVADITINFKSALFAKIYFIKPKSTSVFNVLSCASSKIITEYFFSIWSIIASLRSIPSVMYFKMVFFEVWSSNLIEYPTSSPRLTSISSLTLWATDMAATLLGCVHAMHLFLLAYPAYIKNWGIWVVLPEPVSPTKIIVWYSAINYKSLSLAS